MPGTYLDDRRMKKIHLFLFVASLFIMTSCDSKGQKAEETCLLERAEQISTAEAMKRLSLSKIDGLPDWKLVEKFCDALEQSR